MTAKPDPGSRDKVTVARANKRQRLRFKRRYIVRFGREKADTTGVILNLSRSGLFIAANSTFKPGNQLLLDFQVDGVDYNLEGVVRWARQAPPSLIRQIPSGMGIEILSPPESYLRLVGALQSRTPENKVR